MGEVIAELLTLQAKETAGLVEAAFARVRSTSSSVVAGDWARVGYELGVLAMLPPRQVARRPALFGLGDGDTNNRGARSKPKPSGRWRALSRKRNRGR